MKDQFQQKYDEGDPPWDTGITPPELVEVVAELPPGRAIDLGCGTGTNVIYLAEHGWQAVGVDFIADAIQQARRKAEPVGDRTRFLVGDIRAITDLVAGPFDLAVDIGCGHVLPPAEYADYARQLADLLPSGSTLMHYVHHYDPEKDRGKDPDAVREAFGSMFDVVWHAASVDTSTGDGASWFRLRRR